MLDPHVAGYLLALDHSESYVRQLQAEKERLAARAAELELAIIGIAQWLSEPQLTHTQEDMA